MEFTRRDLLTWGSGITAGLVLTPVPWKLLDDTSIWTQNWPWIPQPARGPVEVKNSFCALCPNGCGMRVRMAAGWPVGISGMQHHPVNRGALCPLGFGAHQLNWHPRRLRQVGHQGRACSWSDALAAFRKACAEGPVAIIDGYPDRAASAICHGFARRHGSYRVALRAEQRALLPYEKWSGVPAAALGYDLENTGTILSFGAPLLDGWSAPGRFARLWSVRGAGSADSQLRLIQVEAAPSHTAACAWRWVPIMPGSDAALAAGIALVLHEEHRTAPNAPVPSTTLADAAARTGLSVDAIRDLARLLCEHGPALAISAQPNPAVAALNVALGAIGTRGGIVRRGRRTEPLAAADTLPSHLRAVLVDASVPADFLASTEAEIFRFAAWEGSAGRNDWLLPAPGFLEELTDIPTAPLSSIETYAVAPPLSKPPAEVKSAAQFLMAVDSSIPDVEKIIHARCRQLFQSRAGHLQGEELAAAAPPESAQAFEKQLWSGAVWVGDPPHFGGIPCRLTAWPQSAAPVARAGWTAAWPAPVLPPLATKLYQESSLREPPERRAI